MIASALMLTSCKKDEFQTEEDAQPREFKVNMTDNPGEYEALTVELNSVEVYNENSGWITLNSNTQFISVLDLTNGKELQIASMQNAEMGAYSKVRLNFGQQHELKVKSSVEIGGVSSTTTATFYCEYEGPDSVEVEIDEQISAEEGVDLLIDFDVASSIQKDGEEYIIKPTLKLIKDRSTGVQGKVKGAASASLILTDGEDTLSSYTNADGEFLIRGMEEGTYDLICYPQNEDGEEMMSEQTVSGVVVTKGEIENTGTIRF